MMIRTLLLVLAAELTTGCGTIASIGTGAGAMPVHELPKYDGPRQVIYRIDEHRYITIEGYRHCDRYGLMYWNDDRKNLRVLMSRYKGVGNGPWWGRFVIDPGEEKIAIPGFGCGDKACYLNFAFSIDGGRTWGDVFTSEKYSDDPWGTNDSSARDKIEGTEVRVTADGLIYVIPAHRHHYYRYKLDGTPDQRPRGTSLRDREDGVYNWEDVASVPEVKTPSGQERFTCDSSLNPPARTDDE